MNVWVLYINAGFYRIFSSLKAAKDYAQSRHDPQLMWVIPPWITDDRMLIAQHPNGTNYHISKRKVH